MSHRSPSDIQAIITQQIGKPVDIIHAEYHEIRAFDSNDAVQVEGSNRGLDKAFGWFGANPNSESKKRHSRILYAIDPAPNNKSTALPTKKGLDLLVSLLTTGKRVDDPTPYSDIFIVGARGSGKSAASNYVFNSRFEELMAAQTTLFRADIAKLHDVINVPRHQRGEVPVSITKYVILHAFMVAIAHSDGQEQALKKFFPYKNIQNHRPHTHFESSLSSQEVIGWHQIVGAYRDSILLKGQKDADLIAFINETNNSVTDLLALDLWKKFSQFLKSAQGGNLKRIVLMFDGVDNLRADQFSSKYSIEKTNHDWYLNYLYELINYFKRQAKIALADQFVYSFRNTTKTDFDRLSNVGLGHEGRGDLMLNCVPQKPARIFIKRLLNYTNVGVRDLVTGSQVVDDTSGNRSVQEINERLERTRKSLEKNTTALLKIFAHEMSKYSMPTDPWNRTRTAAELIKYVFNGNIRSFLRNMIRSHIAVDEFSKLSDRPITPEHRFECCVLAGNFLFPKNSDSSLRGRWCPNLFEVDIAQSNGKWAGLCCVRILQILPRELEITKRALTFDEIKGFLINLEYEEKVIESSAQILFEFGLLQIRDDRIGANARYYKTDKGSFIEWLTFNNISVFYLMAASSKFPRQIKQRPFEIEKIEGVWVHKRNSPRYFLIAAARTAVQFMRSIKSVHSREEVQLEGLNTDIQNELKKYIVEPQLSNLIEDLSKRLKSSESDYESELSDLLREWAYPLG